MISFLSFLKIDPARGNTAPRKIVGTSNIIKLTAKVPNGEILGIISFKLLRN